MLVVQDVQHPFLDDPFDAIEVFDHTAGRPAIANGATHGNLETIRMAMHPRALSGMKRQCVCGLESEALANLRSETFLQFSLRAHRFEAPLEIGEETARHIAVDDAMVE
jgi:hypothetical protein